MTVVLIEKICKHAYKYMFSLSSCLVIIIMKGTRKMMTVLMLMLMLMALTDEIKGISKRIKNTIISQEILQRDSLIYSVLLMTIDQICFIHSLSRRRKKKKKLFMKLKVTRLTVSKGRGRPPSPLTAHHASVLSDHTQIVSIDLGQKLIDS